MLVTCLDVVAVVVVDGVVVVVIGCDVVVVGTVVVIGCGVVVVGTVVVDCVVCFVVLIDVVADEDIDGDEVKSAISMSSM